MSVSLKAHPVHMTHPVALITGASSGIGEYLAYEFARKGYRIVLCARRRDKLTKVADQCLSISSISLPLILETDVTQPVSVANAVKQAIAQFGRLDCVVANAGFGVAGRFHKLTLADFQRQFQTNIDGVLNTIYASLDALKVSKGSLVLMGSINSYVAQPKKAPYCMSKFAVRALAESLYVELKPEGVAVTLVCPGMVDSEIRQVDNQGKVHEIETARPPCWLMMPTKVAAKQMVRGIIKRKREVIITKNGWLGIYTARFFPGLLLWFLQRFNPQLYENSLRPR